MEFLTMVLIFLVANRKKTMESDKEDREEVKALN